MAKQTIILISSTVAGGLTITPGPCAVSIYFLMAWGLKSFGVFGQWLVVT
jgi:hypothetical protein